MRACRTLVASAASIARASVTSVWPVDSWRSLPFASVQIIQSTLPRF